MSLRKHNSSTRGKASSSNERTRTLGLRFWHLWAACVVATGVFVGSARATVAYLTSSTPPTPENALHQWHVGTATTTRVGSVGLASQITGLAWDGVHGVMYGVEQNPSQLCTVNLTTGLATIIGSTGMGTTHGLAINPVTGGLYGVAAGGQLFSVNPATGMATPIGSTSGRTIAGLTFAPDGRLLGCGLVSGGLYELDVATGAQTLLYSTVSLSGIAFDPADGQMYGVDNFNGRAYRIDFATGATTNLGHFDPLSVTNPKALVFVPAPSATMALVIGTGIWGATRRRGAHDLGAANRRPL